MSVKLLAIPLLAPAIWNLYTTFRGLSDFFDLPTHPSINPGQFAFGVVVTIIVIGFVVASRLIWSIPIRRCTSASSESGERRYAS